MIISGTCVYVRLYSWAHGLDKNANRLALCLDSMGFKVTVDKITRGLSMDGGGGYILNKSSFTLFLLIGQFN